MQYRNLNDLVHHSSSSGRYYFSLPTELQLQVSEHRDSIHSAFDLHEKVRLIKAYNRAVEISESLGEIPTKTSDKI